MVGLKAIPPNTFTISFLETINVRKRARRTIASDDEDETVESTTGSVEVKDLPSTQERKDEELSATTKRLKLEAGSPKKSEAPSAVALEAATTESELEAKEDKASDAVNSDNEAQEVEQVDEIEQEKEAVEIKQAAAKWYTLFAKGSD